MAKTTVTVSRKARTLEDTFPWILVIGGLLGFYASFILTLDKIKLIENPKIALNCNLNPLLNCTSVIKTAQASAFGFPNSLIGIGGFAVVTAIGMAMLAGLKPGQLKRWFWIGLEIGTIFGVGLVHWLFFETVYRIHALCPYCMVVWSVTIPLFLYTTLYNIRTGVIKVPAKLKGLAAFIGKHHGDVLLLWFLIIAGLILNHFWYFWKTVI